KPSQEGFALEQILRAFRPSQPYFWATHGGAELDLFFVHKGRRLGFEVKFNEAPKVTASMRVALEDLRLDHLWVVHPGHHGFPMADRVTAVPLPELTASLGD
ncbi:MAG: ATP-binding protein, partial [Holophaga sp.]|nr:ATP-binding protein [Holophaga sp.]